MQKVLSNRVRTIAGFLICGLLLATGAHCQETDAAALRGGFGLECRGAAGSAFGMYVSAAIGTRPIAMRMALEADACSTQLSRTSAFGFRSAMAEIGTGSFLPGPFAAKLRAQFERYELSSASVRSVIPLLSFDVDVFYLSAGFNFRTFAMDDGNPFDPYFSAFERQFTFEIGGRIKPTERLTLGVSMRNFDDFTAGSFASIGYRLDCALTVDRWDIGAELGLRPSGPIALAATSSGFTCRIFLGRKL